MSQIDNLTYQTSNRGFTLVEMAIVLLIVALLLGGLLVPISAQIEQRKISETQQNLDEVKEALYGYAIIYGRLPRPALPDHSSDGDEMPVCASACKSYYEGYVPWKVLNVTNQDAWGHRLRYTVSSKYTEPITLAIANSATHISVRTRKDDGTGLVDLSKSRDIPATVLSHGKNAYASFEQPISQTDSNRDESINGFNNTSQRIIISRDYSGNTLGQGGEFDDMVTWISPTILMQRLVAVNKLP